MKDEQNKKKIDTLIFLDLLELKIFEPNQTMRKVKIIGWSPIISLKNIYSTTDKSCMISPNPKKIEKVMFSIGDVMMVSSYINTDDD